MNNFCPLKQSGCKQLSACHSMEDSGSATEVCLLPKTFRKNTYCQCGQQIKATSFRLKISTVVDTNVEHF